MLKYAKNANMQTIWKYSNYTKIYENMQTIWKYANYMRVCKYEPYSYTYIYSYIRVYNMSSLTQFLQNDFSYIQLFLKIKAQLHCFATIIFNQSASCLHLLVKVRTRISLFWNLPIIETSFLYICRICIYQTPTHYLL